VTGAYPVLHVGSFGSAGPVQPTRPWARTFPGVAASVPEARRFVAGVLAGCPAREVLMTCISELCTNAIAHTASGNGGVFTVEVELPQDGVARISVTDDGGPSLPAAASLDPAAASLDPASLDSAVSLDLMAEGGRGLALVAACTSRWGYIDAHPGRTVWAEACWPVPVPSPDQDASRNASRWHRRFSPAPPGDWPSGPAA
jgi:anti-sigma regulatory factor (Ser/Thr protein kinase)